MAVKVKEGFIKPDGRGRVKFTATNVSYFADAPYLDGYKVVFVARKGEIDSEGRQLNGGKFTTTWTYSRNGRK